MSLFSASYNYFYLINLLINGKMMGYTDKLLLSLCFFIVSAQGSMTSYSYGQFGVASEEETNSTWPTKMTFHETKTNYMLGSAMLKRLYARMEHTENLFKAEMNQMFEKLRDQIQKNFRKCDRQRRRADVSSKNGTSLNNQKNGANNAMDKKQANKKDKHGKDKKRKSDNNKGKQDKKSTSEGGWYSPEGYQQY